jgi:hypothetical protein
VKGPGVPQAAAGALNTLRAMIAVDATSHLSF